MRFTFLLALVSVDIAGEVIRATGEISYTETPEVTAIPGGPSEKELHLSPSR